MPPPPEVAIHDVTPVPSVERTYPFVPAVVGSFNVHVPAASATDKDTVPDVVPLRLTIPVEDDAVPTVILVPKVGAVENTNEPDPVSSVTAAARLALDGVPRKVRIPVPVAVVDGAAPAPPPITRALAVNAPEDAQVDELLK